MKNNTPVTIDEISKLLDERFNLFRKALDSKFDDLKYGIKSLEIGLNGVERDLMKFRGETKQNFQDVEIRLKNFKEETEQNFQNAETRLKKFQGETEQNFQDVKDRVDSLDDRLIVQSGRIKKFENPIIANV